MPDLEAGQVFTPAAVGLINNIIALVNFFYEKNSKVFLLFIPVNSSI